jgi:hypothetical protein
MIGSQTHGSGRVMRPWIEGTALPSLGLGGFAFFVASVIVLDQLQAGSDPVATPISLYVLGAYGYVMTAAFLALGLATLAVAVSLVGYDQAARAADGETPGEPADSADESTSDSQRRVLVAGGLVILAGILITVRAAGSPFVVAFFMPTTVATVGILVRPRSWLIVTPTLIGLTVLVALFGAGEVVGLAEPVSLTFASTVLLLTGLVAVLSPWVRSLAAPRLGQRRGGGGLLAMAGICLILVALFPTDPIAAPGGGSVNGMLHVILSYEAVLAIAAAMLVVGISPQRGMWRRVARPVSRGLAVAGSFLLVVGFALLGSPVSGLAERLSILVDVGWLVLLAVLLRAAARRVSVAPISSDLRRRRAK